MILEQQHRHASSLQEGGPGIVALPLRCLRMLPAVEFHREPTFVAVEVQNEPPDDVLAAELETVQLLSAQPPPKRPFRVGRASPQAPGAGAHVGACIHGKVVGGRAGGVQQPPHPGPLPGGERESSPLLIFSPPACPGSQSGASGRGRGRADRAELADWGVPRPRRWFKVGRTCPRVPPSRRGPDEEEDAGVMAYTTLSYERDGRVARIVFERPERLNAIAAATPGEIADAVAEANADDRVHVIVLAGRGAAFCAGYDLRDFAEGKSEGVQERMPWDPMKDYALMKGYTEKFMSLWRSYKPTICKVQGYAVAGGSDIALCCDLVVMAEDARIGYPPARVWGCPSTAMWVYRLGAEGAKRMLLTGDLATGAEAKAMGLVTDAVPADRLDARVDELAERLAGVPRNQLMMQKLAINQAIANMGLESTQTIATIFDGIARHSPEGMAFKHRAEEAGFKQAVRERDSGEYLDEIWPIRTGPVRYE